MQRFPSSKSSFFRLIALLITVMACSQAQAAAVKPVYDPQLYQSLEWRNIGPFRGGRVTAVAGHADQIFTFYFGATGGGVWKTENGGVSWNNISDGYFATGTIGGIAVAPSDPNVVYVGTGESPIRGVTTRAWVRPAARTVRRVEVWVPSVPGKSRIRHGTATANTLR